jgi:hypothetical protein
LYEFIGYKKLFNYGCKELIVKIPILYLFSKKADAIKVIIQYIIVN